MKSFVFTPLAARDLNEIWDYLASDNIKAADRVLDALEKALRGLVKILARATGETILPTAGTVSSWSIPI